MNPKLLWTFGILGMGILEKMNPVLCEFLENFGTKLLKIKSGTLWIFGSFGHGNFF